MIALIGVFIAGLTAGGLLFALRSPATSPASDDGRTALAFLMNSEYSRPLESDSC
jgi:hypothetical protein